MYIKINGQRYRLRNSIIIRFQGLCAIGLGLLCNWQNATGAATVMMLVGIGLLLGKCSKNTVKINRP